MQGWNKERKTTIKIYTIKYHTWESDENTWKHPQQDSQDDSPFRAADHKAEMNRHARNIHNKKGPQQKHRHGAASKKSEGLKHV